MPAVLEYRAPEPSKPREGFDWITVCATCGFGASLVSWGTAVITKTDWLEGQREAAIGCLTFAMLMLIVDAVAIRRQARWTPRRVVLCVVAAATSAAVTATGLAMHRWR